MSALVERLERLPGAQHRVADNTFTLTCPGGYAGEHTAYLHAADGELECEGGCSPAEIEAGIVRLTGGPGGRGITPCPDAVARPGPYLHRAENPDCLDCKTWRRYTDAKATEAATLAIRSEGQSAAAPWRRLDLRKIPKPTPPTVGQVSPGVCLFARGRRHNLYGEGETGKSWVGSLTASQEATAGRAAIVLNGEMEDEDVKDWLLKCLPAANEQDLDSGVLVYPAAGLLDVEQRKMILSDVAASGRELSFVFVDSQTSVLSQAGLRPNDAEDIERLWRELGGWFTHLPSRPAFVMSDHLSKGADGSTPTGSIRKRNVVDTALFVETKMPFSPETPFGPAVSGYSAVTITKGRRGGRGLVVARIVGHESRVRLLPATGDLPWMVSAGSASASLAGVADATLTILREVAREEGRGTDAVVQALPFGQTEGYRLLRGLAVNEAEAGSATLLIRRSVGKSKVPTLTDRGREVLRLAAVDDAGQASSSTSISP